MSRLSIVCVALVVLTSCTTMHSLPTSGIPHSVDVVREFTPLTTTTFGVLLDKDGKPIQIVATEGTSITDAVLRAAGIAAMVYGVTYIGSHLKDINTGSSTVTVIPPAEP